MNGSTAPSPRCPRPTLAQGSPRDRIAGDGRGYSEYTRLMFDMIALAFQTDSTRAVSHIPRTEGDEAKCYGYLTKSKWDLHTITHNAQEDDKIGMWRQLDAMYLSEWAYFLGKLKAVKEGNGTLLDNTMAAWATTNGGPNAHDSKMLPLILCGGSALGLKHQGHLVQEGHAGGQRLADGRESSRHAVAGKFPGRHRDRRGEGAGMSPARIAARPASASP